MALIHNQAQCTLIRYLWREQHCRYGSETSHRLKLRHVVGDEALQKGGSITSLHFHEAPTRETLTRKLNLARCR